MHRPYGVPVVAACLMHLGFLRYLVSISTTHFVVLIIYFFNLISLHFFFSPPRWHSVSIDTEDNFPVFSLMNDLL